MLKIYITIFKNKNARFTKLTNVEICHHSLWKVSIAFNFKWNLEHNIFLKLS